MDPSSRPAWSLALHGGAGVIAKGALSPEQERVYRQALQTAAGLGAKILAAGGSALDAVEAVVCTMEDDSLFNAGRGSVFTAEGRNEMDAAIMSGETLTAGAIAGVTTIRHPIALARAVMEHSPHVMMVGEGAERFARSQGLQEEAPGFFFSERRWRSLEKFLHARGLPIPEKPSGVEQDRRSLLVHDEGKMGTVGAVAQDIRGHLAAATSTGGTTGKRWGRVGDSPIIGAGCYASDRSCAVSCTGAGEYFIRLVMAHAIAARFQHDEITLQTAIDRMIRELMALGGTGGAIAIARDGQIAWGFNTEGMYRARVAENRPVLVGLYGGDDGPSRQ